MFELYHAEKSITLSRSAFFIAKNAYQTKPTPQPHQTLPHPPPLPPTPPPMK